MTTLQNRHGSLTIVAWGSKDSKPSRSFTLYFMAEGGLAIPPYRCGRGMSVLFVTTALQSAMNGDRVAIVTTSDRFSIISSVVAEIMDTRFRGGLGMKHSTNHTGATC